VIQDCGFGDAVTGSQSCFESFLPFSSIWLGVAGEMLCV